jgi:hypothetical protein
MKKRAWLIAVAVTTAACSAANAGVASPEIDSVSSVGAVSLLLGALALIAERRRKRHSAE